MGEKFRWFLSDWNDNVRLTKVQLWIFTLKVYQCCDRFIISASIANFHYMAPSQLLKAPKSRKKE